MTAERRLAPRYQFVAYAEVVEIATGTRMRARTGDLSIGGCFLETLNPLAPGADVRVMIFRNSLAFTIVGRVVSTFANVGMGISFTSPDPNAFEILKVWIVEQNRPTAAHTP